MPAADRYSGAAVHPVGYDVSLKAEMSRVFLQGTESVRVMRTRGPVPGVWYLVTGGPGDRFDTRAYRLSATGIRPGIVMRGGSLPGSFGCGLWFLEIFGLGRLWKVPPAWIAPGLIQ